MESNNPNKTRSLKLTLLSLHRTLNNTSRSLLLMITKSLFHIAKLLTSITRKERSWSWLAISKEIPKSARKPQLFSRREEIIREPCSKTKSRLSRKETKFTTSLKKTKNRITNNMVMKTSLLSSLLLITNSKSHTTLNNQLLLSSHQLNPYRHHNLLIHHRLLNNHSLLNQLLKNRLMKRANGQTDQERDGTNFKINKIVNKNLNKKFYNQDRL